MSNLSIYVKAASELAAEGLKVTFSSVRARVGRGSYSTISDAICVWRAGLTVAAQEPGEPPEQLQRLLQEVWVAAHAAADSRLLADRAALAATRTQLETLHASLADEADALAEELDKLRGELSKAIAERDAAVARATQAEVVATEMRRALGQRLSPPGAASAATAPGSAADEPPF